MSESYVLNEKVAVDTLERLNNTGECTLSECLYRALGTTPTSDDLDQASDFITALKSGKKIVNPLSAREELKDELKKFYQLSDMQTGYRKGIHEAVRIIAKEHPDVADWLGDQDA
ncbi:hypothetical protein NIE88_18720 [Sporolactobacillus shoreicorticis]|uniref:Uncharacterized protein n=1 Tax=Sporolactobacillus shoreicorticis TaxID=1923877 RepID=A0ABW5S8W9_9BACL|nr:hypothetical protein [Sporolactobacillus shoreicorticis]MCO7127783.1 hypothetical protein [Sporolactobacillus shoreicorticis]